MLFTLSCIQTSHYILPPLPRHAKMDAATLYTSFASTCANTVEGIPPLFKMALRGSESTLRSGNFVDKEFFENQRNVNQFFAHFISCFGDKSYVTQCRASIEHLANAANINLRARGILNKLIALCIELPGVNMDDIAPGSEEEASALFVNLARHCIYLTDPKFKEDTRFILNVVLYTAYSKSRGNADVTVVSIVIGRLAIQLWCAVCVGTQFTGCSQHSTYPAIYTRRCTSQIEQELIMCNCMILVPGAAQQ